MKIPTNTRHIFSRRRGIMNFQLPATPNPRRVNPFEQTGPVSSPGSQPNTVVPDFAKTQNPDPMVAPASDLKKKTRTSTQPKSQKNPPKGGKGTSTKTKNRKKKRDNPLHVPVILPKGPGRPNDDNTRMQSPIGPSGNQPYLNGPSHFTRSNPIGKISEIEGRKQLPDYAVDMNESMGNIRTLIQTIDARWLSQHETFLTTPTVSDDFDNTHTVVMDEFVNKMTTAYQSRWNINETFINLFQTKYLWIYFYDTFALYAELVCLIQRAAYYKEDLYMTNPLLDRLAIALNTTVIDGIRNEMARALRYQFLPEHLCDLTYEMFQTYRLGQHTTATSIVYVTPAMEELIDDLGLATDDDGINAAYSKYITHCKELIELVVEHISRTAQGSNYYQPMRYYVKPKDGETAGSMKITIRSEFMYNTEHVPLTSDQRRQLNSYFERISEDCRLRKLTVVPKGNSDSHHRTDFCDQFNNRKFYGIQVSSDISAPIGVVSEAPDSSSVAYASEVHSDNITFKNSDILLENFEGCAPLYFVTSNNKLRSYYLVEGSCSRHYLRERNPIMGINNRDGDVRFVSVKDISDMTDITSLPIIQENYIRKVYVTGTSPTVISTFTNPDGSSTASWYITKGDLLEMQKNEANLQL